MSRSACKCGSNILSHGNDCCSGGICISLLTEGSILFLLVCCDDSSGGIDDRAQTVLVEEVDKVSSLTALRAVTGHQDEGVRHDFSQNLTLLRIGRADHGTDIAVIAALRHALRAPCGNLLADMFIQGLAVDDSVLKLSA